MVGKQWLSSQVHHSDSSTALLQRGTLTGHKSFSTAVCLSGVSSYTAQFWVLCFKDQLKHTNQSHGNDFKSLKCDCCSIKQ